MRLSQTACDFTDSTSETFWSHLFHLRQNWLLRLYTTCPLTYACACNWLLIFFISFMLYGSLSTINVLAVMSDCYSVDITVLQQQFWNRGVARNLLRGGTKQGSRGRKPPSGVHGQSPGGGLGSKPPEAGGIYWMHNGLLINGENNQKYTTQGKLTQWRFT